MEHPSTKEFLPGLGFIKKISEIAILDRIVKKIADKNYFTSTVSYDHVKLQQSDIVLLVSPLNVVEFVAHVRPARSATTGTNGFKGDVCVKIGVPLDELLNTISVELKTSIISKLNLADFRPSLSEWKLIWKSIKSLDLGVDSFNQIVHIEKRRFENSFDFERDEFAYENYFQKDAIGVALQASGIQYNSCFANLSQGLSEGKSLLESLTGLPTEDVIIAHDTWNFPDFLKSFSNPQSCIFTQGKKVLKVINVNRRPGERALGVDLIYHNLFFNSFTFVQYKMYEKSTRNKTDSYKFHLNNQYYEDVSRIEKAKQVFSNSKTLPGTKQYRLANESFFFKFCPRTIQKLNDGILFRGHYVSFDYLQKLTCEIQENTPSRKSITPEIIERWLTRTLFAKLVSDGWIGTNQVTDTVLQSYVESTLDHGNVVLYAEGNQSPLPVEEEIEEDY